MHLLAVAVTILHGIVMQGPTQPVCQVGTPCSKPAVGVTLRFTRTNGAAVTVITDSRGRYSVRLTRGTYTVKLVPERKIGSGITPRTFTARGTTQRLDFDIDTGIR
jgi:hypothetical protein